MTPSITQSTPKPRPSEERIAIAPRVETGYQAENAPRAAIWLLGHYPDRPETDARVETAAALAKETGHPIFLFATKTPRYPESIECVIREKLINKGVPAEQITCSIDVGTFEAFETIQEMEAVFAYAKQIRVPHVICVSNRLQLMQLRAYNRRETSLQVSYVASPLEEKRWWYLLTRIALIPLAFFHVGHNFFFLRWVREARQRWKAFPF